MRSGIRQSSVVMPDGTVGVVYVCDDEPRPHITVESLECQFRGEFKREAGCDLCGQAKGQPFAVMSCAKYGECSIDRRHTTVRACRQCIGRGQNL